MSDENTKSDGAVLLLAAGFLVTGVITGFVSGQYVAKPQQEVTQTAWENGYEEGYSDGLTSFPDEKPRVLFHKGAMFNWTIAFVYPDTGISYKCLVSRATVENGGGEWVISRDAFKYNGTVQCSVVQENLVQKHDSGNVSDTLLRNEVTVGN